ncbi:MAG TPA: hypothetical protein VLA19_33470, partial [Herpetosiphonaceae bacterium]|nr:hypothetical protein [Herpetosiphonaceae bacterium]
IDIRIKIWNPLAKRHHHSGNHAPDHFLDVYSNNEGLLEDAVSVLLAGEVDRQRYRQRDLSRNWLRWLRGRPAEVVARALRHNPQAAKWYTEGDWLATGADPTIRAALGL